MKKNYLLKILFIGLLFFAQQGFSQNSLADNEFGSLIQNWLNQKKDNFNLSQNDILDLEVSDAFFSKKTKINHVYVNQSYQGIRIHNAISSVAVKDNYVFYYDNGFISNIASKINTITPTLNAEEAISSAVSQLGLGAVNGLQVINSSNNEYLFSNGGISKEDIPVKLIFQPTEEGIIKLAWDLSLRALNNKNWFSVRVDALTGNILDKNDWIVSCDFGDVNHTDHSDYNQNKKSINLSLFKSENSIMVDGSQYNVFPIPTESPNHGPIQLISEPANLTASPYGWHDIDGVLGAEFTITRGNNVYAQEDSDGNDGFGYAPDGGAILNFNFPFNEDQQPIGYQDVAITNLFYMNNIMHDVWYQYGFDEVSGNFQQNNYGNGGAGNDFVIADAQDGSGLNNANFGTPPDGSNGGMQMYLWSASGIGTPLSINNGPLAGDYTASIPATGTDNNITGPSSTPVTANLVLVNDSSGAPTEGCNALTNGANVSGKIAVIKRGNCPFVQKIQNAQDAGAIGVIMVNHNNPTNDPAYTEYVNMAGLSTPVFTIPSVFVNNTDGELLIAALLNGDVLNGTIVESGPYQKDGDLDNGIVAHEYGHGISTRLAGGASNSNCLNNAEQMGEGWSDWFALMLTMKATDLPETARGIATYSVSQPTTGGGIRPFPYSTDTIINPLTYADTNDDTNISQPHGIGTVWATILWDLTWKYVEKYGFDSDIYNGTGGNNKIMQLVLDGLKLQTCNAGFVRGRAGLLAADMALTGGEDQCMIWEVFAARGVGLNASQGTAQSRLDQVEDFTMPPDTNPTLANCTSLSVEDFNALSDFTIYPNPTDNMLYIKTNKNFGKVILSLVDINGRQVLSKEATLFDKVELNISALQSGIYILNIKGENINSNSKIIKN